MTILVGTRSIRRSHRISSLDSYDPAAKLEVNTWSGTNAVLPGLPINVPRQLRSVPRNRLQNQREELDPQLRKLLVIRSS